MTVNSTLLSAAAAALRDYVEACGGDVPQCLTVVVPTSFKQPSLDDLQSLKANNDFSAVLIDLPKLDEDTPALDPALWGTATAVGARAAQSTLSLLPKGATHWCLSSTSSTVDFGFSNINGCNFSETFVSLSTGVRKRVRGYCLGGLNGTIRIFIVVIPMAMTCMLG